MSLLVLLPFPSTLPLVRLPSGQQQVLVQGAKGRSVQTCLFSEGFELLFSSWLVSWSEQKQKQTYIVKFLMGSLWCSISSELGRVC